MNERQVRAFARRLHDVRVHRARGAESEELIAFGACLGILDTVDQDEHSEWYISRIRALARASGLSSPLEEE